jgi:hypothetical protein
MGADKLVASAVLVALLGVSAARANEAPTIVVPGHPGAPVMWFGHDISWSIIEGERGLDRPGNPITIRPAGRRVLWSPSGTRYYPTGGRTPRLGRDEKEPPPDRPLPPPAESYHREWGASSMPAPATLPPDPDQPPIVAVPQIYGPPVDHDYNRRPYRGPSGRR